MGRLKQLMARGNRWQERHRWFAVPWAVQRKYSTDQAGLLVVALGWYGFTAIYPLLLVVVTLFGFIGVASLGRGIVDTLHQFPVIGQQFTPGHGSHQLHGSVPGLVIGILGLLYGAQGVTQTAQTAMDRVWNVPQVDRAGFLPRLSRSVVALACIGGAFLVNAFAGSVATASGSGFGVRAGIVAGQLVVNVGLYLATFRALIPDKARIGTRCLLPGAVLGGVAFTVFITIGTGLVEHSLRGQSATYGAFASVIGVVTFLLLLAKVSIYAAELNPVLFRRLYPRALPLTDPLAADRRVLVERVLEERRRKDERIEVSFEAEAEAEAGRPARQEAPT